MSRGFIIVTCLILAATTASAQTTRPVFPGKTWETRTPEQMGCDRKKLDEMARVSGGRGCVIRSGYLIYTWGDATKPDDVASASKTFYSHLLFAAIGDGKLKGVDDPVSMFQPCLLDLNAKLDHKDRKLTFRHLANQTACFGFSEEPGTAFDYNDATMGFYWDTLVNKVYGLTWAEAEEKLFGERIKKALQFEDKCLFDPPRGHAGRPIVSPRDFARFGLLYLHQGDWNGKQLIAKELAVMAVTDPLPLSIPRTKTQKAEACRARSIGGGANQTDHNGGYSWLWWINGVSRDGKRWWEEAPADMFTAQGHGGEHGLAVLPAQELIVSWNDTKRVHEDRKLGGRFFGLLRESVK